MSIYSAAARGVEGYEYRYRASVDDRIAKFCKPEYVAGKKTYLFEIRTVFIMKTFDSQDIIMDWERFRSEAYGNGEVCLLGDVEYRLGEYWMTIDEIKRFVHEVFDFAVQTGKNPEHASRWLICIVVDLEVRTVQQVGETIDSVMNRVIREAKLEPVGIYPGAVDARKYRPDIQCYLQMLLTGDVESRGFGSGKIRVENVEEGLKIMQVCKICLMGPMLGTYISVLPSCKHAFHSHCFARKMLVSSQSNVSEKYLCPTCKVRVFPPSIEHLPPQAP